MKKVLTVLFGLLFLQNAYSESLMDTSLKSEMVDYLHDKMDENAIRALCEKLLMYAYMHNFDVLLEYTEDKYFHPTSSDCKKYQIDTVSWILEGTAVQLSQKTFENHSQCAQDLMKKNAFLYCENFRSPRISELERQGFTVDLNEGRTIIDCSKTDNRCVVNRPVTNGGFNGYLSICCSIPVLSCDETKNGSSSFTNAALGNVGVHSMDVIGNARTINDFDFSCKPLNK